MRQRKELVQRLSEVKRNLFACGAISLIVLGACSATGTPADSTTSSISSSDADPAPTLVRPDTSSTHANEALALLPNQGYFTPMILGNPAIAPDPQAPAQLTYWESVMRIYNRTGGNADVWFQMYLFDHQRHSGWDYYGKACTSGAFLVLADQVTHNAIFDGDPALLDDFHINICVVPEPTIWIVEAATHCTVESAVDENGVSLVPAGPPPDSRRLIPRRGDPSTEIVPLVRPDNAGEKIAQVKGHATVFVPATLMRFEIPNALNAKPVTQETNEVRVEIATPTLIDKAVDIRVNFIRKDVSDAAWKQMTELAKASQISILDGNGHFLESDGIESNGDMNSFHFHDLYLINKYSYVPREPIVTPIKVVVEFAPTLRAVRIPFEFHDLPLP